MSDKAKKPRKLTRSPMQCRNLDEVCALQTDNASTKSARILFDGWEVTIKKQATGYAASESVSLSRRDFNALIRWYVKQQKINHKWRTE